MERLERRRSRRSSCRALRRLGRRSGPAHHRPVRDTPRRPAAGRPRSGPVRIPDRRAAGSGRRRARESRPAPGHGFELALLGRAIVGHWLGRSVRRRARPRARRRRRSRTAGRLRRRDDGRGWTRAHDRAAPHGRDELESGVLDGRGTRRPRRAPHARRRRPSPDRARRRLAARRSVVASDRAPAGSDVRPCGRRRELGRTAPGTAGRELDCRRTRGRARPLRRHRHPACRRDPRRTGQRPPPRRSRSRRHLGGSALARCGRVASALDARRFRARPDGRSCLSR